MALDSAPEETTHKSAPKRLESHALPELQALQLRETPPHTSVKTKVKVLDSNGTHDSGDGANGVAGDVVAVLIAKVWLETSYIEEHIYAYSELPLFTGLERWKFFMCRTAKACLIVFAGCSAGAAGGSADAGQS